VRDIAIGNDAGGEFHDFVTAFSVFDCPNMNKQIFGALKRANKLSDG